MAGNKPTTITKKLKVHPWRLCASGEHWVSKHSRKITKGVIEISGHCRLNPSRKDQIYSAELIHISEKYFSEVLEQPKADNLDFKYRGNRYDNLIAGWTKYWNEVLSPKEKLDPNLVKALIATESDFNREAKVKAGKKAGYARGLMQVTDWSLEILRDEKGELQDYLVNLNQKEMKVASLNTAAGIRWLHRKRQTASVKLKRQASWLEAIADYKSYLEEWLKKSDHKQMNKLIKYYERLTK